MPSRRTFLRLATTTALLQFLPHQILAAENISRPKNFFGINSDPIYECTTPDDLKNFTRSLTTLNPGSIRIPLRWIVAEKQHGTWDFSKLDRAIDAIPSQIEILAQLMSTPPWSTGIDPTKAIGWPDTYPPRDLSDWSNYITKTITRYKSRIHHWEIWNEENGIDFFHPQPDAKAYVTILQSAHVAAKRADPHCQILLGGLQMNGIIPNPWSPLKVPDFLQHLYVSGGGKFFDICNTHPYVLPTDGAQHMIDLTHDTRTVMSHFGDQDKPLWLTEFGCGLNKKTTATDQANFLSDAYRLASAEPKIDRLFWFTLRDLAHDQLGPESSMGLLTHDWHPKPAFTAFQKLTTQ